MLEILCVYMVYVFPVPRSSQDTFLLLTGLLTGVSRYPVITHIIFLGWGSYTSWSKYQNVENEEIFCKHPDQSYIVQAYSRWTDEDDDNRQISWHCSPPDTSNKLKGTLSNINIQTFAFCVLNLFQIWSPEIAETLKIGPTIKENLKEMSTLCNKSANQTKLW